MVLKNRRVFELRLGKLGIVLFIGGMSVLLFALFLAGVFVGKNLDAYPERYAGILPEGIRGSLFGDGTPSGAVAVPPAAAREGGEESSGPAEGAVVNAPDPVAAKKAEAPVSAVAGKEEASSGAPTAAETPGTTVPAVPGGAAAAQPAAGSNKAGKGPPATEAKPAASVEAKGVPPAEKAPPRKGRFEIQAAAYRERPQADQLAKKLGGLGFTCQVVMKEIPGKGQWYRVIVGGFENRPQAQEAADQLATKVNGLKCVVRAAGNGGKQPE